jgi:hypothetical protein
MNRFLTLFAAIAVLGTTGLHSQTPVQKQRNAVDVLKAIREENAKLIERQTESLKKLQELETNARMVKNFAARA